MFYKMIPDNSIARKALDDLRNSEKYYQDSAGVSVRTSYRSTLPILNSLLCIIKMELSSPHREMKDRLKKKSHWDNSPFLNLYYSHKSGDHRFDEPTLFEEALDTRYHDGPAMFYAQYQKMIINRNQRVKVAGRKNVFEWRPGLYDAQFDKAKSSWNVAPLPFNNPAYSYLHPSISEDGKILYFASDKPGGLAEPTSIVP